MESVMNEVGQGSKVVWDYVVNLTVLQMISLGGRAVASEVMEGQSTQPCG